MKMVSSLEVVINIILNAWMMSVKKRLMALLGLVGFKSNGFFIH